MFPMARMFDHLYSKYHVEDGGEVEVGNEVEGSGILSSNLNQMRNTEFHYPS